MARRSMWVFVVIWGMVLCLSCPIPCAWAQSTTDAAESVELTLELSFGERTGIYSGEMAEGLPHGEGSFTTYNAEQEEWTYTGQWVDGHMEGIGTTIWSDGWELTGHYLGDNAVSGQSLYKGTLIYDGGYLNSYFHGYGRLYDDYGRLIYEGEFAYGYLVEDEEARIARADSLAPVSTVLTKSDYKRCVEGDGDFIGMQVELSGEVSYLWEYPDESYYTEFVLNYRNNPDYPMDVFYYYGVDERVVEEGDRITVWGTIVGVYRYTGSDGTPYAEPLVAAHVIYSE